MKTYAQQVEEIEEILRKTPHHKATNGFIGAMRAKISRIKDQEVSRSSGSAGGGGYAVKKQGDATIVLIGPPSAGKSTLINLITNAESKVAAYAFTTVSVIPGMLKHKGAYIQILDVPGLISGASIGKGRGKEVLSVARGADLLLIMTDPKRLDFFEGLLAELEIAGIRVNKQKPNVRIEKGISGGLKVTSNIRQDFDLNDITQIASEFGIKNGKIVLKQKVTIDEVIDSFSQRIVYKPAIFVVNKKDLLKGEMRQEFVYISAENNTGVDNLIGVIWKELKLITVYLVEKDQKPNKDNLIIMHEGDTLSDLAKKIGSEFAQNTKLAKIWGSGAQFPAQEVPVTKTLEDQMMVRFL